MGEKAWRKRGGMRKTGKELRREEEEDEDEEIARAHTHAHTCTHAHTHTGAHRHAHTRTHTHSCLPRVVEHDSRKVLTRLGEIRHRETECAEQPALNTHNYNKE